MRSKRTLVVVLTLLALALGSVGMAYAITNGLPDAGRHPYVGLVVFYDADGVPLWRCSGSLISPNVFLTAGHCTYGTATARVWFDEYVASPPYPYSGGFTGTTYTNPNYCESPCGKGLPGFAHRDTGLVVLDEPVPAEVVGCYAVLPVSGLVDTLKNKTGLDLVGYGVQEEIRGGGQPYWVGRRIRLYAPSELVSGQFVHSAEFLRVALNPGGGSGGTCFGDSGGPDLLGGTDTVLAVNSYVTNYNCAGVGYSGRVDVPEVLEWINGYPGP